LRLVVEHDLGKHAIDAYLPRDGARSALVVARQHDHFDAGASQCLVGRSRAGRCRPRITHMRPGVRGLDLADRGPGRDLLGIAWSSQTWAGLHPHNESCNLRSLPVVQRGSVNAKLLRCLTAAHPVHHHRSSDLGIEFYSEHLSSPSMPFKGIGTA
jgi:hypothetical protein